jgi:hypothetical protein
MFLENGCGNRERGREEWGGEGGEEEGGGRGEGRGNTTTGSKWK